MLVLTICGSTVIIAIEASRMVWPSGGDLAVSSAAIMPEAPALLSTTTDLPSCLVNCSASKRPIMSELPPAGKPLMKRTSLDGKPA